jgi:hypothetical protein
MSIKDDIEALEKALQAGDKRDAQLFAYCTPDRIGRLIDAFEQTDAERSNWKRWCESAEARLSRATDLLGEAWLLVRPSNPELDAEVRAFLSEQPHE